MKIRELVICGDLLNPDSTKEISKGLRLNPAMMMEPLSRALGSRVKISNAAEPERSQYYSDFARKFFGAAGRPDTLACWIALYDARPNPRQIALARAFFEQTLIIGYELPPILLEAFSLAGIPWLDFEPHPARHLLPSTIGLRSNIPGLLPILNPFLLPEATITDKANDIMRSAHFRDLEALHLPNIALFIDEYQNSRGRIDGGRSHILKEFELEIKKILARHDRLIVLPVRDWFSESAEMYLTMLYPKTSKSDEDFIDLIALPQVKAVYTLNSDKARTALYFGKPGYALLSYKFDISNCSLNETTCISLRDAHFSKEFWLGLIRMVSNGFTYGKRENK